MGGLIGALGQVGEAQALGEQQQRKEDIEKAYLAVQQQYGATNKARLEQEQERLELEKQREQRLLQQMNMPQFLGFKVAPDGSLIYGMQDAKGEFSFKKLPYSVDAATELHGIETAIQTLPPEEQSAARALAHMYLDPNGDYKGAHNAVNDLVRARAKLAGPQPTTVTDTDILVPVDDPDHPGQQILLRMPKRTTSTKVLPGSPLPPSPAGAPKPVGTVKTPRAGFGTPTPLKGELPTAPGAKPQGPQVLTKTTAGTVKKVWDAFTKLNEAQTNLTIMQQDMAKAAAAERNSDTQSAGAFDMDLLSRHIAMTFGSVKNVRGGQYLIEEHIKARSLPDQLVTLYQGLKAGSRLSPAQRVNFIDLAKARVEQFEREQQAARDLAGYPREPGSATTPIESAPSSWKDVLDRALPPVPAK